MVRGLGAIGWGGLNLEASVAMPVDGDIDLTQFGLGIRLDTSYLGVFSVYLRAHYLMQSGDVEAQGGHFGLGMQVWAIPQMAFYAEAAADITSVNEEMQNQGTLFSYARYFGGGIRFRFAPGSCVGRLAARWAGAVANPSSFGRATVHRAFGGTHPATVLGGS